MGVYRRTGSLSFEYAHLSRIMNNTLTLTYEQAQFLLCAAHDLDTSKSAYNIPTYKECQKQLTETLRSMCWAFHAEEMNEKELALGSMKVHVKKWPDLLKKLQEPEGKPLIKSRLKSRFT